MRAPSIWAAGAAIALVSTWTAPSASAESVLYHGFTRLDPARERRIENSYVVVEDGRITAVGRGAPPRRIRIDRREDMSGLFAMPGLIDTHAHLTLGPTAFARDGDGPYAEIRYDPAITAWNARMLLAYGVTTTRNPAGDTEVNLIYRAQERTGEILGPESLVAGAAIDRTAIRFVGATERPSQSRSVADIVRDQAALGVDYVKFYHDLTEADLAEGVAAARDAHVRTIAHLDDVSWTRGAELGINALVHVLPTSADLLPADRRREYLAHRRPGTFSYFEWFERVDLDSPEIAQMLHVLARRGVHFDATLVGFEPMFRGDDAAFLQRDLQLVHPLMAENWRTFRFDLGWSAADYQRARAVWPRVLELTRRLYEAGVPLTIGTDLGNPFVTPGASVGREMELHVEAGIPVWAVLRMATSDAAEQLRIANRTGRLARNYEADIVFTRADPSIDISYISEVEAVIDDGQFYSSAALKEAPP